LPLKFFKAARNHRFYTGGKIDWIKLQTKFK
jgi:hypothetical protein